uniref:Uncharacterized protein n=1 Tax=Tanacetum cinerariifolium TaxID=118510 RepID=A0A6L2NEL7_TANCI|nr:hypothetical protein [Tanacetum cinerariifolium]
MKIPSWMITNEIKLTDHYHILCIPPRRSTRLTVPTPVPTNAEADDIILQVTIQVSLTEQKSHDELEAKQNVLKVKEHLIAGEIEKLVEGAENVENVDVNININEEEEESTEDDYELKLNEKGKHVKESRSTPSPIKIRSPRTHSTLISLDTEKLQELMETYPKPSSLTPSSFLSKSNMTATNRLLSLFKPKPGYFKRYKSFLDELQGRYGYLFEHLKTSEQGPLMPGNQEQLDDYDFWTNSYATDDDEIPNEKVSQELGEEMSHTVDEAKLHKVFDETLRQQCTYEHQYHINQMQNFLKNDSVWERRKEIIVTPHPQRPTLVVQSCQRDPKAPALSLVNQDLLYLKKGNLGLKKIMMSLYKFPVVILPDDDIEERTSRWIFYIKKQKEPKKSKEVVYLNSKIVKIIKTYWEIGHEHKFITEIVSRRENGSIVLITESDYKNLNKNDIENIKSLIVNHKVNDYAKTDLLWSLSVFIESIVIWERVHDFHLCLESYQPKVNLTAPTITFPGIEKFKVFSTVSEPVYGIIYKNSKKEKKVMSLTPPNSHAAGPTIWVLSHSTIT